MNSNHLGLIELLGVFALVLGWGGWQWWQLDRLRRRREADEAEARRQPPA